MSFSFDGAHERWLTPLCVGAGLALRDNEMWTADQTYQALHRYGVTNAFSTRLPGQIADWASVRDDAPPRGTGCVRRRSNAEGGLRQDLQEPASAPADQRLRTDGDGGHAPDLEDGGRSRFRLRFYAPIGRPVGERSVYALDVDMRPVPPGVTGELYIAELRPCPRLSRAQWIDGRALRGQPLRRRCRRRGLYRTGDLVRWLEDGRPSRVHRARRSSGQDPGLPHRAGRDRNPRTRSAGRAGGGCRAASDSASGQQLVAYVVPLADISAEALATRIKQHTARALARLHGAGTRGMPARIAAVDQRQAGPWRAARTGGGYRARLHPPRNDTEARLAAIWQEVLGVERVGITDNFFEMGGDSILSLQVISRVRNAKLGFQLRLRDLLRHQTIDALMSNRDESPAAASVQIAAEGSVALISDPGVVLCREYSRAAPFQSVDPAARRARAGRSTARACDHAARAASRRAAHAFRVDAGGGWTQAYEPGPAGNSIWTCDVASPEDIERRGAVQGTAQPGPFGGAAVGVVHAARGSAVRGCWWWMHHLAIDGVSWRVLLEDLQSLSRQLEAATGAFAAGEDLGLQGLGESSAGTCARCLDGGRNCLTGASNWRTSAICRATILGPQSGSGICRSLEMKIDKELTHQLLRVAPAGLRHDHRRVVADRAVPHDLCLVRPVGNVDHPGRATAGKAMPPAST